MVTKINQRVYRTVCVPFAAAKATVETSAGLEKVAKLIVSSLESLNYIFSRFGKMGILTATTVLRGQLKLVADIISGLSLVQDFFLWVCPKEGKSVPFWLVKPHSRREAFALMTKIIHRGLLTGVHAIDFLKLLDSFKLIRLGRIASETVGNVPVLNAVKDVLNIAASIFGIAYNATTLAVETPRLVKAHKKKEQWKEVAVAMGKRGHAANRMEVDYNNAARRNLEIRLARKCDAKRMRYAVESERVAIRLAALSGRQDLVDLVLQSNFESAAARSQARREIVEGCPENQLAVRAELAKLEKALGKQLKWAGYLEPGSGGNGSSPRLVGVEGERLQGYCDRKLGRAIEKADADKRMWRRRVHQLQGGLHQQGKIVGANPEHEERVLREPLARLREAEAVYDVLVQLRENGAAERFVRHRVEVFGADETNAFRQVTNAWLATAYDIAKIATTVFGLLALTCGLMAFGWTVPALIALALAANALGVLSFLYSELVAGKKINVRPLVAGAA